MMRTLDNCSNANDVCIFDAIEQFIRDRRIFLQHKKDLAHRVNNELKERGRAWKPLYDLFEPIGLLPTDANCNGVKLDSFYDVSKIAIKRIDLYLPVMKRLAEACKKKTTEEFAKDEYEKSDDWNQLRNFLRNLQEVGVISVSVNDNGNVLSICPESGQLRFLDGIWAENGMIYLIEKTIKSFTSKHRLPSSVFWNVKLSEHSPWNSTKFEFDVVAKVGQQFYVFEVKTGMTLPVDKWYERWRMFMDAGARYIQCTAKEVDYKLFQPLTLFPIVHFEHLLEKRLERDLTCPLDKNA